MQPARDAGAVQMSSTLDRGRRVTSVTTCGHSLTNRVSSASMCWTQQTRQLLISDHRPDTRWRFGIVATALSPVHTSNNVETTLSNYIKLL